MNRYDFYYNENMDYEKADNVLWGNHNHFSINKIWNIYSTFT